MNLTKTLKRGISVGVTGVFVVSSVVFAAPGYYPGNGKKYLSSDLAGNPALLTELNQAIAQNPGKLLVDLGNGPVDYTAFKAANPNPTTALFETYRAAHPATVPAGTVITGSGNGAADPLATTTTPAITVTPAAVTVVAVGNTKVKVSFDQEQDVAKVIPANFTVASGSTPLAVTAATLSADKKVVTLTTAAQTTGTVYTMTLSNFSLTTTAMATQTFVGGIADTSAPSAVSATASKNTEVVLTFTDANGLDEVSAQNIANYTISPALAVTKATLSDTKEVTLTTAAQTSGTVYTVSVLNVKDIPGNAVTTALTSSFAGKGADTTAPTVSTAAAYSNTKVVVTFNEDVDPTSASTLANYTIAGLAPTAVEFVSTTDNATLYGTTKNRGVVLTVPAQTVGTVYTVSVLGVKDTTGNAITTASTTTFAGKAADTTAPTVATATSYSNTKVVVTFNENVDATSATALANYTIAGLAPTAVSFISTAADATTYGATANRSVLLTVPAQTVGTVYTVSVLGVKDTAGNAITTASTATFAGKAADTTAPTISSVTASTGSKITIVFSEAMDGTSVQNLANYSIGTLGSPVSVDTWTASTRTLILNTATQSNGTVYTLTVNNLKDTSGNTIIANSTATFAGIGNALDAPALSSVTAFDN